jgi:hypothetical protein
MLKVIAKSAIRTEKVRTDGKESRKFYVATFQDALNPFAKPAKRTIFQSHDAEGKASWITGNPELVKLGMEIPGEIKTMAVEAYEITIGDEVRTVSSYTAPVFSNELLETVFKNAGHKLAGSSITESVNRVELTA